MTDIATTIDRYIAAWNEPDDARRRAIVGETWAEDGSYLDPLMAGEGPDQIAAMIRGAQADGWFRGRRARMCAHRGCRAPPARPD
jgi:hypothetical protein